MSKQTHKNMPKLASKKGAGATLTSYWSRRQPIQVDGVTAKMRKNLAKKTPMLPYRSGKRGTAPSEFFVRIQQATSIATSLRKKIPSLNCLEIL